MKNKEQDGRFDGALLDRLVDGELREEEYRKVLRDLESQPDGWRRCALAFLEAQAWGREFRSLRNESQVKDVKPAEPSQQRRGSWFYLGAMAVACAASFMLAFGVAMRLQDSASDLASPHDLAAESADSIDTSDGSIQFASESKSATPSEAGNSPQHLPLGRYQLVLDGGAGTPQAVEMPVFAADDPRANLLLDEYASKPHEIIRALERSGHDVQSRRNWIPVRGSSGTPLYVPVDELQVTPVSNRSFQ